MKKSKPPDRGALAVSQKHGYHVVMNRSEAINRLKGCAEAIKARGATSLYLFGSAVRDEARADSDLLSIVELSNDLQKSAERLNKTPQ